MRIAVGTDHAGLPLKQVVVAWLVLRFFSGLASAGGMVLGSGLMMLAIAPRHTATALEKMRNRPRRPTPKRSPILATRSADPVSTAKATQPCKTMPKA